MVQASEQKGNAGEISEPSIEGALNLSEAERAKILKDREVRKVTGQRQADALPDNGGSQVATTLSREDMLKATEGGKVDARILNPSESADAAQLLDALQEGVVYDSKTKSSTSASEEVERLMGS